MKKGILVKTYYSWMQNDNTVQGSMSCLFFSQQFAPLGVSLSENK